MTDAPRPASHRGSIPYVPALDGLRAVAVAAVIAFHFGVGGVPGGFLGVDVFFVLSGYLITSLLTAEWSSGGTVSLRSFWGRRARRLFPALAVTLVGVVVAARLLDPQGIASLRSDALSTLGYVANWHFIASSQAYFTRFGPPSPLLHTWSLAVEEQFYVVWPLVTIAAVKLCRRHARAVLVAVAAGGVTASALLMATGYHASADPSRLYYGTDTHAQVILVGALLALLRPGPHWAGSRARRALLSVAGVAGAAFVALELHLVLGNEAFTAPRAPLPHLLWLLGNQGWLYRGGFASVAVAVAAVIALVVSLPANPLAAVLGLRPLRYVGRISYGLYLYHWPVFVFLSPPAVRLTGIALLSARLAVTLAVAVLSFHLLETPVRQGLKGRLPVRAQGGLLAAGATCVVASVLVATAVPVVAAAPALTPAAAPGLPPMTVPAPAHAPVPAGTQPARVLLLGDSVALTLGYGLAEVEARYNVRVVDQGSVGCSIAETNPIEVSGHVQPLPACNPFTGQSWQQFWAQQLAKVHPDVVALLLGRWEAVDRVQGGEWTRIGEPAYDSYLRSQLEQAVRLLSSGGARVVLLTSPYFAEAPSPDGSPFPEDDPARVDAWNGILRDVAGDLPAQATVLDVGGLLSAGGTFASSVDGLPVRCSDGIHISLQGGELAAAYLLPDIEQLAAEAYADRQPGEALPPVGGFAEPRPPAGAAAARASVSDRSTTPTCPY